MSQGQKPGGRGRNPRLDQELVARGLCESRTRAKALIMAGQVLVDGAPVDKPGTPIKPGSELRVRGDQNPYVSRGGLKLASALEVFEPAGLVVAQRAVMDVGASTGGFTDCVLRRGARVVHAVDVGYGQLAWKLARDPRVVVHDRTNIRKLDPAVIGEPIELVVVDCSFISLAKVVVHLPAFLAPGADVVALCKPQFELDPERVGKGGIVREDADREEAVARAVASAASVGFSLQGRTDSGVAGKEGNREIFLWLRATGGVHS